MDMTSTVHCERWLSCGNTVARIATGFPEWSIIDQDYRGKKYAKDKQVARCGNAVPPPFAEALVRANLPEMCDEHFQAA